MRFVVTIRDSKVKSWEKVEKADRGRFRTELQKAVMALLDDYCDVGESDVVVERLVIAPDHD